MSFEKLTTELIAAGRADDQLIFHRAKENFDNHESRIVALRGNRAVGASVTSKTASNGTDLDGISVQITTTGRPVLVYLAATTAAAGGCIYLATTDATDLEVDSTMHINREDYNPSPMITESGREYRLRYKNSAAGAFRIEIPCSAIAILDYPPAGTFVYQMRGTTFDANHTLGVENAGLVAVELR